MTEEEALVRRVCDLAEFANKNNRYMTTDFLSLFEQNTVLGTLKKQGTFSYSLFGGAEGCERQVLRFGSPEEFGYEEAFPVVCVEIKPVNEKFGEVLSHRDYLGALMNLGIKRSVLGDILIREKTAYLFCLEKIAPYIIENLCQVCHTQVICAHVNKPELFQKRQLEETDVLVESVRCDAIAARLCKLSRSAAQMLFADKKVFINGRMTENVGTQLHAGDVLTIRGYGKYVMSDEIQQSKKGKYHVKIGKYV